MKIQYDYSKLLGKIKEVCKTQEEFAKMLNLSAASINYKLNNKKYFTQNEIFKAIEILDIKENEIQLYFFNQIVEKN